MPRPTSPPDPLNQFPDGLRDLLRAEIAEGNAVIEIGGPPAPPVGQAVWLARPVATGRRRDGSGFTFYERNSSSWSGEFTDPNRHFFVLEPPRPPPPEPDMDAIRSQRHAPLPTPTGQPSASARPTDGAFEGSTSARASNAEPDPVARFVASRRIDYHKWREGEGYDLMAIAEASPEQRRQIESLLTSAPAEGWREVEALAALETPKAETALLRALESDKVEVRLAVLRLAPELVPSARQTEVLAEALATVKPFGGLSDAESLVLQHHPPPVIDALWRGVLHRGPEVAPHFAGLLLYLGGQASSPFDWSQRPFLLRFNTTDPAALQEAFLELCQRLGRDPDQCGPAA